MSDQLKNDSASHPEHVPNKRRPWILLLGGLMGVVIVGMTAAIQLTSSSSIPWDTLPHSDRSQSMNRMQSFEVNQVDGRDEQLRVTPPKTSSRSNSHDNASDSASENTGPRPGLRPVIETEFVEQTDEVGVPTGSPADKNFRREKRTRMVPVQTTRWVPVGTPATASRPQAQIMRLVQELKNLEEPGADSTQLESRTSELRELLTAEFTRMHEQQAAEIEATEKRLAALKTLHQQRGEKKSEIVQRRIDQLLGKTNPLDWNINAPEIAKPRPFPGLSRPPASTYAPNDGYTVNPNDLREGEAQESLPYTREMPADSSPKSAGRDQPQSGNRNQNDFFAVIGKANQAHLAAQSTKLKLGHVKRLFDKNIITSFELGKATLEHEAAQNAVAVLKLQLESMQRTFQRELADALQQVRSEAESLKATRAEAERAVAKRELRNAQSTANAAAETLSQFEDALRLVPFVGDSDKATDDAVAPPEDPRETKVADEKRPVKKPDPRSERPEQ